MEGRRQFAIDAHAANPDLPPWGSDESEFTHDGLPRCSARSRQNDRRCKRAATPGTTVCATHGSRLPGVKKKAQLRLAQLVDPAIATLAREMVQADRSADRQRAANSVLDRTGFGRATKIEGSDARALLIERLAAISEKRADDVEGEADEEFDDGSAEIGQVPDPDVDAAVAATKQIEAGTALADGVSVMETGT